MQILNWFFLWKIVVGYKSSNEECAKSQRRLDLFGGFGFSTTSSTSKLPKKPQSARPSAKMNKHHLRPRVKIIQFFFSCWLQIVVLSQKDFGIKFFDYSPSEPTVSGRESLTTISEGSSVIDDIDSKQQQPQNSTPEDRKLRIWQYLKTSNGHSDEGIWIDFKPEISRKIEKAAKFETVCFVFDKFAAKIVNFRFQSFTPKPPNV